MGSCKDPALSYLNQYGYNVVKLPRAGIEPLDVLGRDRVMERLGTISEVWTSAKPAPSPGVPAPAANLDGKQTENLDLAFGLKILSNALAGLGSAIGLPTLNANYKRARSIQFRLVGITSVGVTPFAIGSYLAAGSLDLSNPFVTHYFGADETDEYIISEVLKSDSVSVTAKRDTGTDLKLDIPALQGLVGANVALTAGYASEGELVYSGKIPITFGFKCYQVFYENAKWVVKGTKPSGDLAFAAEADADGESPVVLAPGRMIRMS
jgi:hypothetical protein